MRLKLWSDKTPAHAGVNSTRTGFFETTFGIVSAVAEAFAGMLSLAGIPVALFFGKLFLAAILAGVVCGVVLRLRRRRPAVPTEMTYRLPLWSSPGLLALSVVEVAFLVEATKLPVRTDQPDFSQSNWLLVLLAVGVAYFLQRAWFRRWFARPPSLHAQAQQNKH